MPFFRVPFGRGHGPASNPLVASASIRKAPGGKRHMLTLLIGHDLAQQFGFALGSRVVVAFGHDDDAGKILLQAAPDGLVTKLSHPKSRTLKLEWRALPASPFKGPGGAQWQLEHQVRDREVVPHAGYPGNGGGLVLTLPRGWFAVGEARSAFNRSIGGLR